MNFKKSPIDNIAPLIKNNISVTMLYGNANNIVIYEENGKVLEAYYKEKGGIIKVIAKSMCGHHPHGLEDVTPIIEFAQACGMRKEGKWCDLYHERKSFGYFQNAPDL